MTFRPEFNDEEQNMIGFLLGATLKALNRPGGYKEFNAAGFGKRHVLSMLEKFGHDTTKLKQDIEWKESKARRLKMCLCGHEQQDDRFDAFNNRYMSCMECMMCNEFLSPQMMRG